MSTTMTINVDEQVAVEFRRAAAIAYGRGKGHLGKAVQEALKLWAGMHRRKSADGELIEMLKKGFHAGGVKYKHRSELYDRG